MISEGEYDARATRGIDWVQSPEKGTAGVHLVFRIVEDCPAKDQTVDYTGWISDNNAARIDESLRLCGYDGDNDKSVMQNVVRVVVKHETTPRGTTYARVAFINDPNRARFEKLDPAGLTAVKARLRAAGMAAKAATGNTKPDTSSVDDDIAF